MSGSTFGRFFQITTWGESHGPALGCVVDGVPAGISLNEDMIQWYLDRRKPGQNAMATPRKEDDRVEILSGVFEGKTTGSPVSLMIRNTSQHSADYTEIATYYRPGHADYTFDQKYGFRDYRGGGRSSGRETAARVAGGAIAAIFLKELGIDVCAYTEAIGPVQIKAANFDREAIYNTPSCMPDKEASEQAEELLRACRANKDSAGGIVACRINHLPAGLGDPVFEKLDANLAKAILSIGAVKAFEVGDGYVAAFKRGSENNDAFAMRDGKVIKATNHAGGILGGISDGDEVCFRAYFKPTPSIARTQHTVNKDGDEIDIEIKGRHDPVIVPRAVVVVECMAALTIADALLSNMGSQLSGILSFYHREN